MPKSYLLNRKVLNDTNLLKDDCLTLPLLRLPINEILKVSSDNDPGIFEFTINSELFNGLLLITKEQELKLSTLFMAVFKVLLQRYSGQEDILLTQVFINDISKKNGNTDITSAFKLIRSTFHEDATFLKVLNQLNELLLDDQSENLHFDKLAELIAELQLGPEILKALFSFEESSQNNETTVASYIPQVLKQSSNYFKDFYLGLHLKETTHNVNGVIYYNSSLFEPTFIVGFYNHFINLLNLILADPNEIIGKYQILTQNEYKQLIVDFNDTITPYQQETTLYNLFEAEASKSPDSIALIKGTATMTYGELNILSNRLAHYLIQCGILPGDNVGLLVGRDFSMIIGMLGILKAGGAYVPIDPDYPIERQEYIFSQSLIKIVVADKNYPLKLLIDPNSFLNIDFFNVMVKKDTNPELIINSKQLAYTIYTSGSTGKPKGVMIEHHSAVNLIEWVNTKFKLNKTDRLLFITSMCFDLSVYDIFGMLSCGGQIVIAEQQEIQNVKQLQTMLIDYQITFWDSVPTTLDYLILNLESEDAEYRYNGLKTVFLSGDWIPVSLPERIMKFMPQCKVISLGGATEGTIWSNYYPVKKTSTIFNSIPYGKPISNNFFYILNKQLQPVPFGVRGDLYIGGVGVARGYANELEKTAASFIPDPFNKLLGGMMYRTGDLGRMMPDLNIEFLGREDSQVKIQGFRIELGEIENVLKGCNLVSNAVVLVKDDNEGIKTLIAYVVPQGGKYDLEGIVSYLGTKLPAYMLPAVWIEMESLPVTSNGKINRKLLQDINVETITDNEVSKPYSKTEELLKTIWQDSMGIPEINIKSNFFELGGHSLMAVQILSKIQKKTKKSFQLGMFFKHSDIESLAKFIDTEEREITFVSLVPIKAKGYKPPLYIIHGEGLNVLNFSSLAACIDPDQPIYGLQAKGLNEIDQPLDTIPAIAQHYIEEILMHNPTGPYLLSGYSFGGYVAVEMNKQLLAMGKEVKMLIMFDTNAEKTEYKDWYKLLPKKVKKNFPKFVSFLKLSFTQPITTFKDHSQNFSKRILQRGSKKFYQQIKKIKEKHLIAFRSYKLTPFDSKIFLFKAKICVHYVKDEKFLGWTAYAKKGVEVLEVPGDHLSMLEFPNVEKLAKILQEALDAKNSDTSHLF